MTDLHQAAKDIREQFEGELDLAIDEVEDRLDTLVNEYRVPRDEARRSVISHYLDAAEMDREELSGGASEQVEVAEVDAAEEWVDLTVTVVDLWEPRSDSVAQVGLLGDETGTIKFTKWAKSDLPSLELDQAYRLSNVVTDEYEGRFSVKLNRTTTIESIEETIDVGDQTVTAEGALIDVQSGSGLIKRCPEDECTRVLQNGRCSEHGEVEGQFDLRIKAVLDDGQAVHEVIFDKDATEGLTGMTLEEAKDMAMDALDTSVVAEEMCADIVGRYYRVKGPQFGRYVLADDVDRLSGPADPDATLIKARSI